MPRAAQRSRPPASASRPSRTARSGRRRIGRRIRRESPRRLPRTSPHRPPRTVAPGLRPHRRSSRADRPARSGHTPRRCRPPRTSGRCAGAARGGRRSAPCCRPGRCTAPATCPRRSCPGWEAAFAATRPYPARSPGSAGAGSSLPADSAPGSSRSHPRHRTAAVAAVVPAGSLPCAWPTSVCSRTPMVPPMGRTYRISSPRALPPASA